MKALFFCCTLFLCLKGFGQPTFPYSFLGRWEGVLYWYHTGKPTPQKVKMHLIIRRADSAGTFSWQIIYGSKGADNRPYLLRPVDTARRHWQIDEGNGIVLNQYFVADRLTGSFSVQGSTLVNSYYRQGKNLVVEFYSHTSKPETTTGLGTSESPGVDSYRTKSFQRATLKRAGN